MPVVRGLRELENDFRRLRGVARADVLERALHAAGLEIENPAKELAPYRSGTLRRSLHTETNEKSDRRVSVLVGTISQSR